MRIDLEGAKARAEERFKKAAARVIDGAEGKAEYAAGVIARDANTERLKGLRLDRDQAERDAATANPPPAKKSRSSKPAATSADKQVSWGDLNIALNALVKEGVIIGYKAARAEKKAGSAIEITTAVGADQAKVISRVRQSLPEAFSGASIWTRTA